MLGFNTYIYPHLPSDSLETSALAPTVIKYSLTDFGQYTHVACTPKSTVLSCINLEEENYTNVETNFNITEGCYVLRNCTIAKLQTIGKTLSSITTLKTEMKTHTVTEGLFDAENDQLYEPTILKNIAKLEDIVNHNMKQLKSISKHIKVAGNSLIKNQDTLKNIVHIIRSNSYVNKEWLNGMKKCSFWDTVARTIRFDFLCIAEFSWCHWIKEFFWITLFILIPLTFFRIYRCISSCLPQRKRRD